MAEKIRHSPTEPTFPTRELSSGIRQFFENPPKSLWFSGAQRLFLCEPVSQPNSRGTLFTEKMQEETTGVWEDCERFAHAGRSFLTIFGKFFYKRGPGLFV
jgi:hypothetical protein